MTETYLLYVHHETDSAWKVSECGDEEDAFWLPKEKVDTNMVNMLKNGGGGRAYEFEIPQWLAVDRGLE